MVGLMILYVAVIFVKGLSVPQPCEKIPEIVFQADKFILKSDLFSTQQHARRERLFASSMIDRNNFTLISKILALRLRLLDRPHLMPS